MKIHRDGWVHQLLSSLSNQLNQSKRELKLFKTALEHAYEGIIIVDAKGMILDANETYAKFVGQELSSLIGKHVTQVIENTRMHIVAQTGQAEIGDVQKINGHQMIANRIPIHLDGEVVAVVGKVMFQNIDDLFKMNSKYEKLRKEIDHYQSEMNKRMRAKYSFDHIVGESVEIEKAKNLAKKLAKSDTTVLLFGESGTGKELFAHAIHRSSQRAYGPLVRVNCAAIPESLFESELFGYKEGSFTGAKRAGKPGKFSLAHKGTLFLDEISEMPLNMQVKLLRVLQEKEIEPVGAEYPEAIDVRIIAATNKNLAELVAKGLFRQDLYYRLNVVQIEVPPLRERKADIPILAQSLLKGLTEETGIKCHGIDQQALEILCTHYFKGNVRELRNILERALYMMDHHVIKAADLAIDINEKELVLDRKTFNRTAEDITSLKDVVEKAEREAILFALEQENHNKLEAAKRLKISKSSLYSKLEKYNID